MNKSVDSSPGPYFSYFTSWVPDIFPNSCQKHDDCYATCGKTKSECDASLSWPYGWGLQHVFTGKSQTAYNNAQRNCLPCGD